MHKLKLPGVVGFCAVMAIGAPVSAQSNDDAVYDILERSRAERRDFEDRLLKLRKPDPEPTLEERRAKYSRPLEEPIVLTYNTEVGSGNLLAAMTLSMTMNGWRVWKDGPRWQGYRVNHLYCDQLPCAGREEGLIVSALHDKASDKFELVFDFAQADANRESVPLREQGVLESLRSSITHALMVGASWPFGDRGPAGEGRLAFYDNAWQSALQANGYGTQSLEAASQLAPGKNDALSGTFYHARPYTEQYVFNGVPVTATVRPWARYLGHMSGTYVHQHIDFFDELVIENGEQPVVVYRRTDSVHTQPIRDAVNRTVTASR